jgi:hypothetical protein
MGGDRALDFGMVAGTMRNALIGEQQHTYCACVCICPHTKPHGAVQRRQGETSRQGRTAPRCSVSHIRNF